MNRPPIVLASKSAARAAVLSGAGVTFETQVAGVDEEATKQALLGRGASAREVAEVLAEQKAVRVSKERPGLVIGSDQTLEFEERLYDKASDLTQARERLRAMRGKTHRLHSAVVVARDGAPIWRETVSANLTMRNFSDGFLDSYLAVEGGTALSSVGVYRLESLGSQLFSRIEGDYFAILGLPLLGLLDLFRREGALAT